MTHSRSLSLGAIACFALGLATGCITESEAIEFGLLEADEAEFRGIYAPGPQSYVKSPLEEAHCKIHVEGEGWKRMETDYLPHVIACENGGADEEALKAQAIAARSVAYYAMENDGSICDSQGCQVYGCKYEPSARHYQAVAETSGIYLSYNGVLTYPFYVAGDPNTTAPNCVGTKGVGTEGWVTYNQGKTGEGVKQTKLGWVFKPGEKGYGQNRGCMSQWGARCLEDLEGYGYEDILRFYYGEDIEFTKAPGSCVLDHAELPADVTWEGSPIAGASDICAPGDVGCDCREDDGCDEGLSCDEGFCVPSEQLDYSLGSLE